MTDTTETLYGATIQHGPSNNRIYLMKLGSTNPHELIPALADLAKKNGYTKIFCKIPASQASLFLKADYKIEAAIPHFYNGREAVCFICWYADSKREKVTNADVLDKNLMIARERQNAGLTRSLRKDAHLRPCTKDDAEEMAALYRIVFPSYPFPIDDPAYLLETMQNHVDYFGIEIDGRLVALSSAEMDMEGQNAEMTDFATYPDFLGHGFAAHLLATMEPAIAKKGILTAYTIARAESPAMNATFARLGYTFGGRLANNTQISGCIETMNVWHKESSKGGTLP